MSAKTKTGRLLVAVVVVAMTGALSQADPETFSIDAVSPSLRDPADLLNVGMSVQIPKANLGLMAGDELDALSGGNDAVHWNNIIYFSVDRNSMGMPGPMTPLDVLGQAVRNQQAGDVFVTTDQYGTGTTPQGINSLYVNQNFYGEIPIISPLVANAGLQDNLDAFSFEEFDLLPLLVGDGIQDRAVFFSLRAGSPSLTAGISSADILASGPFGSPTGTFSVIVPAARMGLQPGDDLDALVLNCFSHPSPLPMPVAALFSLAPGSPTLIALGASPADIFYTTFDNTNVVRYNAASLGLLFDDNVDALEVQIPEPATMCLLVLGGLALIRRRRK